jgi:hypothetical protein
MKALRCTLVIAALAVFTAGGQLKEQQLSSSTKEQYWYPIKN